MPKSNAIHHLTIPWKLQVDAHHPSGFKNNGRRYHETRSPKRYVSVTASREGKAPYIQTELRDIFRLFFKQLVTTSRVPDLHLPNADELVLGIFRNLFALIFPIETFMAEVLLAIVDESLSLSGDVLKIIMAQLMDKSAEENFEQIRTAHDLVKRIHASSPNLLPTVIPQLEEELHATLRVIATQVLEEIFADKYSWAMYHSKYIWNLWDEDALKRRINFLIEIEEMERGVF
ncbi:MAG: hypothetical protein NXY57DRAFT_1035830 [Lentinula lateritia]|uniref:PXA domain-containing protein n=1 Tax=Lentinula lateritia TaxID=40482 RepID=A0ABQ8VMI3_9AGAR|nr:MAG: hypothetical protein NXY57DRAFT_1035830 [Lentinula lateritia]KAJ4496424.1 hypothetical protein C8R41DRAFT_866224 [Lentinula lateritia]